MIDFEKYRDCFPKTKGKCNVNYGLYAMWERARQRAAGHSCNTQLYEGLDFTITVQDVIDKFPLDGCCPITRKRFKPGKGRGGATTSASIDRIDASKGYTPDNIRVISLGANCARTADARRGLKYKTTPSRNVGSNHGCAKLTEEDVLDIRTVLYPAGVAKRAIARMYRVSFNTIDAVVKRNTWKHI